ncbi:MAG: hypothetical protein ABEK59_11765 [Halobacteria archaeon]
MAEITDEDGGDPTEAVTAALSEKQFALELMDYWFSQSENHLLRAAETRREQGSTKVRRKGSLHNIQQLAVPPSWDEEKGRATFSYPHEGAIFQEFGARPTEIRARKAEYLAFEWPDAPREVKEQFEHTEDDLVFFKSINHPGIPGIGFVRKGRDKTAALLDSLGLESEIVND